MATIRPAQEGDLQGAYDVWYRTETLENEQPLAPGQPAPYLRHVLRTGALIVAEEDGALRGFAGAITRGNVLFLTDLFIDPTYQSGGLGHTLLHAVAPASDLIRCTVSSSDPRALALYIRSGMRPQWPCFALRLDTTTHDWSRLSFPDAPAITEAAPDDPDLLAWDTRSGGRPRATDLAFWRADQGGVALWCTRDGQRIGYAIIRLNAGSLEDPSACAVGPVGATTPEEATACALAAVAWATQHASVVTIEVPGPHACLPVLLDHGCHILYADTFVSTVSAPFFDARCYIPSGGDLF
ncbi:MAG TPA: GNAT family N-acetyltransferase [Ktedonobacterales bacterium]|nr:GNAT family N-acetyltransferase [Ktedonobacterales bacterium]